jgi:hypothetical protein
MRRLIVVQLGKIRRRGDAGSQHHFDRLGLHRDVGRADTDTELVLADEIAGVRTPGSGLRRRQCRRGGRIIIGRHRRLERKDGGALLFGKREKAGLRNYGLALGDGGQNDKSGAAQGDCRAERDPGTRLHIILSR